ncbi:MAG: 4Fe-4S ferredoxin, partial [Desulfobacterales bacterium]
MEINRRHFFKISGTLAAASVVKTGKTARAANAPSVSEDAYGCLVDTTLCVGCRKCEQACNERHNLPNPNESFEEMTVLENERRMDETSYTVVN